MTDSDAHNFRAVEITVSGIFEGQRFPSLCRQTAQKNRLVGWVRENSAQDTVAIHLEGMGYQVSDFLEWIRAGVEGVRISRIDMIQSSKEDWDDFEILS